MGTISNRYVFQKQGDYIETRRVVKRKRDFFFWAKINT
jgi:hypothetical protein